MQNVARKVLQFAPIVTPADAAVCYLENLAPTGRRSQRLNLHRAARILGATDAGAFEWSRLTAAHLEFVRARLEGKRFAASVTNATLSALRGTARAAWHRGEISTETYARIKDVRGVRSETPCRRQRRALTEIEISKLFDACNRDRSPCSTRDAAALALLYAGGLRRAELTDLTIKDYDRRSHSVRIHGKGSRRRLAYLVDPGARRAVHAWLRIRGPWAGPLICPIDTNGKAARRSLSASGIAVALDRRADLAGVRHFTPHDLRRTFASHLAGAGINIDVISTLLDHADIRTTSRYLMHTDAAARSAASRIRVPYRMRGKAK